MIVDEAAMLLSIRLVRVGWEIYVTYSEQKIDELPCLWDSSARVHEHVSVGEEIDLSRCFIAWPHIDGHRAEFRHEVEP